MKRLHLSVNVSDLREAVVYYSALFGSDPDVQESDYARWRLAEPAVNFAVSARGRARGVDHLGIDVDCKAELQEVTDRLKSAGQRTSDLAAGTCCYHQSVKSWSVDPAGMAWETFHTSGRAATYGTDQIDDRSIASLQESEGEDEAAKAEGCC